MQKTEEQAHTAAEAYRESFAHKVATSNGMWSWKLEAGSKSGPLISVASAWKRNLLSENMQPK